MNTKVMTLVIIVCLVISAVALTFAGMDPATIVGLLSAVTGVALPLINVISQNHSQTEKLDRVERATNGELEGRIRTAVRQALAPPRGGQEGPGKPPRGQQRR